VAQDITLQCVSVLLLRLGQAGKLHVACVCFVFTMNMDCCHSFQQPSCHTPALEGHGSRKRTYRKLQGACMHARQLRCC
jgi:hypothetical protein